MEPREPVDCIAFIVLDSGRVLAERRAMTRRVLPATLTLPGGHVEPGESLEAALRREMLEELAIVPTQAAYICTLLHRSQELRRLHYFAVVSWSGTIQCREAEALIWIPVSQLRRLDLDVDRAALEQCSRGRLLPWEYPWAT